MVSLITKSKLTGRLRPRNNCQGHQTKTSTREHGYSLSEVMIIVAILGLIGSIALPSSINLVNREKMRIAVSELTSFIQNSRKSAILHSTSCLITISNDGSVEVAEANSTDATNHCSPLNTGSAENSINLRQLSGDSSLTVSLSPCSSAECILGFSYKGTSLSSVNRSILLESEHLSNHQRCLLITSPLGFVRTGFSSSGQEGCSYIKTS